ncbi:MAG: S8 family serine peptidase, partial [Candidatus Woesearchaeota archaeon]
EDIFPYGEPALPSHFSQTRLRDNVLIDNRFQEQQFNGYIVRLKEEPLAVTYSKNKLNSDLQQKLTSQRAKIESEHNNLKTRLNELRPDINIRGEVTKVLNAIVVDDLTSNEISTLRAEGYTVTPNYRVYATLMDSVPLIGADDVWELDRNGRPCEPTGSSHITGNPISEISPEPSPEATPRECLTGKGVTIGIIDTGVDYTHVDLGGCFGPECKVIDGWDFVNGDNDPMDDMGHGTHVAATAAGDGVLKGVAPDADIVAYKVLDEYGGGWFNDIIAAIDRSVDPNQDGDFSDHLDVISLSLGGGGNPDDDMSLAIDNAVDLGVVAVVAAGNDYGEGTIGSPGTARKAITVGAVDKELNMADFSSKGPVIWEDALGNKVSLIKPDIVAPGVNICAAQWEDAWSDRECLDDEHTSISGTSMATPHVAGLAALIKQRNPRYNAEEIKTLIKNTAALLPNPEKVTTQGFGLVNALESVFFENPMIINLDPIEQNQLIIDITGEITGNNFEYYELAYASNVPLVELDEADWSLITVSYEVPSDDVVYDNLDLTEISGGEYLIRLKVFDTQGRIFKDYGYLNVDHDLMDGWPINLGQEWELWAGFTPTLADINNDGSDEIFIRGSHEVFAYFSDGTPLPGWPQTLGGGIMGNGAYHSVSVGDIDNDGDMEIVAGWTQWPENTTDQEGNPMDRCAYAWESDGTPVQGWPIQCDLPLNASLWGLFFSSMSLVDLNNDGYLEIIASGYDESALTYIFDYQGNNFGNWPLPARNDPLYRLFYSPTVGDVDADGEKEVILIYYYFPNGLDDWYTIESHVAIFDSIGNLEIDFDVPLFPYGDPVMLDMDGDFDLEICFSRGQGEACYHHTGIREWDWNGGGYQLTPLSLATGDLNNDGSNEIVFGNIRGFFGGDIYVLDRYGEVLPGWPQEVGSSVWVQPVLADLNNDDNSDIITTTYGGKLFAFDFNGNQLFEPKQMYCISQSGASVGDVDGDGVLEIVAVNELGDVFVWKTNGAVSNESLEWPMLRNTERHTGCYDCFKAQLLWDNYQGEEGYDHESMLSSERRTFVTWSWTADDAVFDECVDVQKIKWIGMRQPHQDVEYNTAEVVILDSNFNTIVEFLDVDYTAEIIGTDFDMETYEGTLSVPDITLEPGHYYFGVRLVGNYRGRNHAATTGNGEIQGQTQGVTQSGFFGYPEWTFVEEVMESETPTDFAYRIYGVLNPSCS